MSLKQALSDCLSWAIGEVGGLRLRVFECFFTFAFLIWMGKRFATWEEWLTSEGFHLTQLELTAKGYPQSWPLLISWQVPLFAAAILLGACLVLFNRYRRVALLILSGCAVYAQGVDYIAAFTINKLFIGTFCLLALAPGYVERDTRNIVVSVVGERVIQATLILQYFAAGIAKVKGDWLSGNDVLWSQTQGVYRTEFAAWCLRVFPMELWATLQWVSLGFEVFAPLLFLVKPLRPIAIVLGIGFHIVIALMMKELIYFSFQMMTFYILFIPRPLLKSLYDRGSRPLAP